MTLVDLIRCTYLSIRNPVLIRPIWTDVFRRKGATSSNSEHLQKAADWILESQSVNSDGGSASHYEVHGWLNSFPETTGYIIPTLFDYTAYSGDNKYHESAVEMGEFLLGLQFESGAFQAGNLSAKEKHPSVFNTGQILFGLCRLFKEQKDERYLHAARRAGDWMCEMQDVDGCWRQSLTPYADDIPHTYNVRSAWALLELDEISPDEKYGRAAKLNAEWALSNMNELNWFDSNSFFKDSNPFTHNIGYTLRGILEIGLRLKSEEYLQVVKNAADHLLKELKPNGMFASRLGKDWKSKDSSSCLTGNLQIAILYGKLYGIYKEDNYLNALKKINEFHKSTQLLKGNTKICGGIKGSYPFWGVYCPYSYPNWATKFFIDALLAEEVHKDV